MKLINPNNSKILKLHLQCKTQQEIADLVGLNSHKVVGSKLDKINENIEILEENPTSEIEPKYEFLQVKIQVLEEFKPQLYNIWNQSKINNETSHFGNVPSE